MTKKISYKNVALAATLTLLFFIIGIFLGNVIVSQKYDVVFQTTSDLRAETLSLELQYQLVSANPCETYSKEMFLGNELDQLAGRLQFLEDQYGADNQNVLRLKKYYSLLQIRHYLFYKNVVEVCDVELDLILYFYDNEECVRCDDQGGVLTTFRQKYSDSVKIYSFDVLLEDPALRTLKQMYSINQTPSIVYNGNTLSGFVSRRELEELKINN